MEDDDIRVDSEDEEEEAPSRSSSTPAGGLVDATLPVKTKATLEEKYGKHGRIVGVQAVPLTKEEKEAPSDTLDERKRFKVTFENGERKRYVVVVRSARPNTGDWDTVESEGEAPKSEQPTQTKPRQITVRGQDGKNHIMEEDKDGNYTVDRGLSPNQPTPEKPKPTNTKQWQPLTKPDGTVVAMVDPATGDTVAVTQKDPKDPHVFQTRDGQIITVSPDGKSATDVTPEKPGEKPVPPGLEYVPDYDQDDGGLAAYYRKLQDAKRAGIINHQQGAALLNEAGVLWEGTATHGAKRRDQANTERATSVTQRGQSLDEVQSRRSSADDQFAKIRDSIDKNTALLLPGTADGSTVVDAYRAMLGDARLHAEQAGGYQEVPEIPPASARPIPGSESTQIVMHPGGRIEVSPAGAAPPTPASPLPAVAAGVSATNAAAADPTGANVGAAVGPVINGTNAAINGLLEQPAAPVNPPAGEAGNDPAAPVGLFNPDDHASYLAELGLTPEEAANTMALYRQGVRADHL